MSSPPANVPGYRLAAQDRVELAEVTPRQQHDRPHAEYAMSHKPSRP